MFLRKVGAGIHETEKKREERGDTTTTMRHDEGYITIFFKLFYQIYGDFASDRTDGTEAITPNYDTHTPLKTTLKNLYYHWAVNLIFCLGFLFCLFH